MYLTPSQNGGEKKTYKKGKGKMLKTGKLAGAVRGREGQNVTMEAMPYPSV